MKSITGVYSLDEGMIGFQNQDVTTLPPGERRARGIEMISSS
jgi:simple sugar transport system ATP-binding protein